MLIKFHYRCIMIAETILVYHHGAGVSGSAIAREVSRYNVNAVVLEKCEDVCCGTSKANSAIVHAGYDAKNGTRILFENDPFCRWN